MFVMEVIRTLVWVAISVSVISITHLSHMRNSCLNTGPVHNAGLLSNFGFSMSTAHIILWGRSEVHTYISTCTYIDLIHKSRPVGRPGEGTYSVHVPLLKGTRRSGQTSVTMPTPQSTMPLWAYNWLSGFSHVVLYHSYVCRLCFYPTTLSRCPRYETTVRPFISQLILL